MPIRVTSYWSRFLDRPAAEDQVRLCRERAAREGWEVAEVYADAGLSGASLMRPGIQQLVKDALAGKFNIASQKPSTDSRKDRIPLRMMKGTDDILALTIND